MCWGRSEIRPWGCFCACRPRASGFQPSCWWIFWPWWILNLGFGGCRSSIGNRAERGIGGRSPLLQGHVGIRRVGGRSPLLQGHVGIRRVGGRSPLLQGQWIGSLGFGGCRSSIGNRADRGNGGSGDGAPSYRVMSASGGSGDGAPSYRVSGSGVWGLAVVDHRSGIGRIGGTGDRGTEPPPTGSCRHPAGRGTEPPPTGSVDRESGVWRF